MLNYKYFAGLVDGEGYFGIIPHKGNTKNPPYKYFFAVIKIVSINEEIINLLRDNFGGYKENRVFKSGLNSKDAYTWVVKDKKTILRILRNIRHNLIIKKKIANLLYEFLTHRRWGKRNLTKETIDWRNNIYNKSRQLNHRGLSPAETE